MATASAALFDGRKNHTVFCKLKIETNIKTEDIEYTLKQAWKQLRYEQPQIAMTVEGMIMVYEVPDEQTLQEWFASTFIVSSASNAAELYSSATPIKQATLYYIPKSGEILLRAPHNLLDGKGMLYFTPYPLTIDLLPFWESAHTLNKYYQTTIKDDPEFLELNGHIMRVMLNAIQTPEFQAIPISRDAIVSSMGVAERYVQRAYGNMTVRDIRMGLDVLLGPSVLFVYTFQDQLRLAYSFNDGYEEPTKIDCYLKEIERVLIKELLG